MSLLDRLRRAFRGPSYTLSETGVSRVLGDGSVESAEFASLVFVALRTTDEGPFVEDVFWVLGNDDGTGCVIPQGAPIAAPLLTRLQELPDFDNEAVLRAMGCCEEGWFPCWEREPSAG